jgi:hypothetical protein
MQKIKIEISYKNFHIGLCITLKLQYKIYICDIPVCFLPKRVNMRSNCCSLRVKTCQSTEIINIV